MKYIKREVLRFNQFVNEQKISELSWNEIAELSEINVLDSSYAKIDRYIKNGSVGDLDLDRAALLFLPDNLKVGKNLWLRYTPIKSLPAGLVVSGSLLLTGSKIENLPTGLKVGRNIWLNSSNIKSLPDNFTVNGDLDLSETKLTRLPNRLKIQRNFYLRNTQIKKLPDDLEVEETIYLSGTTIDDMPSHITNIRK